jgi:hypothetical protein
MRAVTSNLWGLVAITLPTAERAAVSARLATFARDLALPIVSKETCRTTY